MLWSTHRTGQEAALPFPHVVMLLLRSDLKTEWRTGTLPPCHVPKCMLEPSNTCRGDISSLGLRPLCCCDAHRVRRPPQSWRSPGSCSRWAVRSDWSTSQPSLGVLGSLHGALTEDLPEPCALAVAGFPDESLSSELRAQSVLDI